MSPGSNKSMMGKGKEDVQCPELQNGIARGLQQCRPCGTDKLEETVSKPPKTPKNTSGDPHTKDICYYAQKLAGSLNITDLAEEGSEP